MKDEDFAKNGYEGNGWSRYQIMVLQQLEDHTTLLQNLADKVNILESTAAVASALTENNKKIADRQIQELQDDIDYILNSETGTTSRIRVLENEVKLTERVTRHTKAFWGAIGAAAVGGVGIILEIIKFIIENAPHSP